VVVQDAAYGRGSPMVLVTPLTEEPSAIGFPGTVALNGDADGVADRATAMVFQLRAIDRTRFINKIGAIGEDTLNEIMAEIDRLTGRTPKTVD
jgi:mRNA-degrading endonuclease toxin of MazEF toxin-antitoxin module